MSFCKIGISKGLTDDFRLKIKSNDEYTVFIITSPSYFQLLIHFSTGNDTLVEKGENAKQQRIKSIR